MTFGSVKFYWAALGLFFFIICSGCTSVLSIIPESRSDPEPADTYALNQSSDAQISEEAVSAEAYPEGAPADNPSDLALTDSVAMKEVDAEIKPTIDTVPPEVIFSPQDQEKRVQASLDEALALCDVAQEFWQKGELDNALEALDQAYELILNVDTSDQPKLIQQKEDLRFLISKRILEIYASRNIVVNGNHNAIPLVINKHVQAEIDHFTTGGERRFFIESYQRSGRYRQHIVRELKAAGLPEELSWLPLIESGFKANALSRARALGLWQFISSTGYKFGLKRDKYIDERLDPEKSTQAAIAYLKELHQIFGDWTTVLAAYNCGEGRVLRVIREQNVKYLDNFWDLYERLPYETARYVPRFLATLHIINNLESYGLDAVQPDLPLVYESVTINRQVHLRNVSKQIRVSKDLLVQLNPELRYQIVPPRRYDLKVPPGQGTKLIAEINDIPISSPPRPSYVYHRVKRGETLSIIAQRYRTSVRRIMRVNKLRSSHYIVAGRLLKIPRRGYRTSYHKAQASKTRQKRPAVHVVTRGDSLWNIAKKYGTTTQQIQASNNLKVTDLHIGQKLKIPPKGGVKLPLKGVKTYQVKSGDSPYTIARQYDMSLNHFLKINQLSARSRIYPGQIVLVE